MEPKLPQSKELCFEIAIVDALNIFCRTVLRARGIISQEKWEGEFGSQEVLNEKYRIARESARVWAKMPMTDLPGAN